MLTDTEARTLATAVGAFRRLRDHTRHIMIIDQGQPMPEARVIE
ncbi:hypothetical protein ACWGLB_39245 [Streptomyces sp. NPDC055893]